MRRIFQAFHQNAPDLEFCVVETPGKAFFFLTKKKTKQKKQQFMPSKNMGVLIIILII